MKHKHYEECVIEFRRKPSSGLPDVRGVVVCIYGDVEESIAAARKELKLGPEWKMVCADKA